MINEQIEQQEDQSRSPLQESFLPRLKAYLTMIPEVRLAYFQPGPDPECLNLSGPDRPRVIVNFSRAVSKEHISKRLAKIRRHFTPVISDEVEFLDVERLDYREACEVAFNAQAVYGAMETIERDRLYRYNVYLEWNAGRRISGSKQEMPPVLLPALHRPLRVMEIERFITPLYRHLKLIDGHLRELERLCNDTGNLSDDDNAKSLAESYMLKSIQSTILITMSVMHRSMRLAARDYRDLFLLMSVFGMTNRERAGKLARCADIRDRLMFQYEEVTAVEVFQQAQEVITTLRDFKSFMLEWLFDHYYAPSGEFIQTNEI